MLDLLLKLTIMCVYISCSSAIGMVGGTQKITLTPDCVREKGTIIHEFLHALGFFHEHSRPDRDKYITVIPENIIPGICATTVK